MSYKKFTDNDLFLNTMRAHPKVDFLIYNNVVYYNSRPRQSGSRNHRILFDGDNDEVRNVPPGHISLYELNIDRPYIAAGSRPGTVIAQTSVPMIGTEAPTPGSPKDYGRIAPWISKDSARSSFRTVGFEQVGTTEYNTEFAFGDVLQGAYPLSASISRHLVNQYNTSSAWPKTKYERQWIAIRNRMDFYSYRSVHYKVNNAYGDKDNIPKNIIQIPSIFYGTRIKPGTVSLKWNFTGSTVAELRDTRENGELVQVSGTVPTAILGDGKVAGVVLYDEGVIVLTGSWTLQTGALPVGPGTGGPPASRSTEVPRWINYGVGAEESGSGGRIGASSDYTNLSFDLGFKGHTETQVMTMVAHARRGEVNYSNNPTFLEKDQIHTEYTSSRTFQQRDDIRIKNTTSSSLSDYNAPFKRQVYVSKITIYDKYKNLLGVATLANPVLKKDDDDIAFKFKLDI